MQKSIIAGVLSSLIAGGGILLVDKLFISDNSEFAVGYIGLIIISLIIGFCFALLLKVFSSPEDKTFSPKPSIKVLLVSSLLIYGAFIYQIYPSYYYKTITDTVIDDLINYKTKHKEALLQIINQDLIDQINPMSYSTSQTAFITKKAMKKHSILSLIAMIHPSTYTSPIMLKSFIFMNISTNYQNDGIYLINTHKRNIKIFSKFKYKAKKSYKKLLLSSDNAWKIYDNKYGNKNYNGSTLCPTKENYLRILVRGKCEPVTNKILLNFLSKPKDELWSLLLSTDYPRLISPNKYRHNKNLMSGISDMVLSMMKNTKVKVTHDTFLLEFKNNFDGNPQLNVITSFKISGNKNWLILDEEYILQPDSINNEYIKGTYAMIYNKISEKDIEKIKKAKVLTIHVKKSGTRKYIKHNIPLTYFNIAYSEYIHN